MMEAFADEEVRHVAVMCSAQSAKTTTIMALMAWAIAEDPGPILWVTSNIKEAIKFARARLIPFLERVMPVAARFPSGRGNKNLLEIYFPGAPLIITGANSPGSLQSTPYRYLFLDEVRSYPPGALEMVMKRTRAFSHNYKVVLISTPDEEQDPMHRGYLDGDQRIWHVRCHNPECNHWSPLTWGERKSKGGFKFESDLKVESGDYDYRRIGDTVRFRCEACGHNHPDTPEVRKRFCSADGGRWVPTNPDAPRSHVSFHYGAQLPHWNPWQRDVEEWLKANRALTLGDPMPLKACVNETFGQPWTSEMQFATTDRYIHEREADYDVSAPWDIEQRRFMTVDVQGQGGRHYYVVVRAWAPGARSRKLHHEKVWSIDALREIQKRYHVADKDVAVDIANWTAELVENLIVPFGWRGLRGDDKAYFIREGVRGVWDLTSLDPALGTKLQGRTKPISQVLWAKPAVQEIHGLLTHGKSGNWQIHKNDDTEYRKQVTAWTLRPKTNTRTGGVIYEWSKPERRPDHYASCEYMQIVCASIVSDGSPTPILGAVPDMPLFQNSASTSS